MLTLRIFAHFSFISTGRDTRAARRDGEPTCTRRITKRMIETAASSAAWPAPFAIWAVGMAIFGMIWLLTSDAFAATADRPALCAQYRGGEVAACIAEMGQ